MQESEIDAIFEKIRDVRMGVIGDFAVDFYYGLQKNTEERSLETQEEVWWASRPRTSLGAAGNVVQNLSALGVGTLKVFGAMGSDVYGRELLHLLHALNADTTGLRTQEAGWDTCVYTKPMQDTTELNRVDFGTLNTLPDEGFEIILKHLKSQMAHLDVLIINQQFPSPLVTEARIEKLNAIIDIYPHVYVLADMRTFGKSVRGITLKVNTEELARLLQVTGYKEWTAEQCAGYGRALSALIGAPVLITRGPLGMQLILNNDVYSSDALPLSGTLDTVGAGDTAVAAFAACAGAGVPVAESLALANLAAAVTIQKVNQTGTSSFEEIKELVRQKTSAISD